ncbi:MAG: hypothetical protein KDA84_08985 [Planctomycetaceae bacterium]|nr:hypothetical protein [Planctomycetaceae bacterium]
MDRLNLAKQSFDDLAVLRRQGEDEKFSDSVEDWLRDDVVAVVERLQGNPKFRRYTTATLQSFSRRAQTRQRDQLERFADTLVHCAQVMIHATKQTEQSQILEDRDRNLDQKWIEEQNQARKKHGGSPLDTRSVFEKIAKRPWFDFVNEHDYFAGSWDLFLTNSDPLLTRQFRRMVPNPPLLGDLVAHSLFSCIEFWMERINTAFQKLIQQSWKKESVTLMDRVFAAKVQLDQQRDALRKSWLTGSEFRLRDACCGLLQAYVAYHPRAELSWADTSAEQLAVDAAMLRKLFRHTGEIIEVERLGNSKGRVVSRRKAQLVDWKLIQQVAAALEDVTPLYESDISSEDLINEARSQYRFVLVQNPRMVFWDGQKLAIEWDNKPKLWELLEQLALRGADEGVDRDHLTGTPSPQAMSTRRNRLRNCLCEAANETAASGQQLASRIQRIQDGLCKIALNSGEIKVLDLESDAWLIDCQEFEQIAG